MSLELTRQKILKIFKTKLFESDLWCWLSVCLLCVVSMCVCISLSYVTLSLSCTHLSCPRMSPGLCRWKIQKFSQQNFSTVTSGVDCVSVHSEWCLCTSVHLCPMSLCLCLALICHVPGCLLDFAAEKFKNFQNKTFWKWPLVLTVCLSTLCGVYVCLCISVLCHKQILSVLLGSHVCSWAPKCYSQKIENWVLGPKGDLKATKA